MKTYHNLPPVLAACAVLSFSVAAPADILLDTDFDGSTGHHVFAGNTDNVTGSSALSVNWTTDASVTSISGLTALSTTSGGFATLQGGTATYANPDVVYISRNLNLDDRATNQRGFSFDFTTDTDWTLDSITVVAEHTNNQGNQNQAYASDLHYSLTGPATLSGIIAVDYTQSALPWLTTTFTDNAGATLGSGTIRYRCICRTWSVAAPMRPMTASRSRSQPFPSRPPRCCWVSDCWLSSAGAGRPPPSTRDRIGLTSAAQGVNQAEDASRYSYRLPVLARGSPCPGLAGNGL